MCSVDFQREHKFGSGVAGAIMRRREAGGDGRLYLREGHHSHIDLTAHVPIAALLIRAGVRRESACEQRESRPVEVELGGTEVTEVQRGDVPFGLTLHEGLCGDLINLRAGEA